MIEAFSNFQTQNSGRCMESKSHCSQIERELERVKVELDDFQLEYKSS